MDVKLKRMDKEGKPFVRIGLLRTGSLQNSNFSWITHPREVVHVNHCENRASLLKPWLAVYRGNIQG
jgi:GTP:adenosylcobinamide-phosphate guanylyltransferase